MPALTSQLNKNVLLRGVTAALAPSLIGVVVFESETQFRLKSLKSAPGVMTQRVTRANGTGLLTFSYRVALTETDYDAELLMGISLDFFGLVYTFADARVDGPGALLPNTFSSSPTEGAVFKFDYGIAAGAGSRFCFLSTNAREYSETGGKLRLVTGMKSISLDVAAPAGTAPTRWTKSSESAEERNSATTAAVVETPASQTEDAKSSG